MLFISDFDVLVLLVDYGCKTLLKVEKIRRLEVIFTEPSRKACKGSCFGIKPRNDSQKWSSEANQTFKAITLEYKIYGKVKAHSSGVYQLALTCDPESQLQISDYLIAKGLAAAVPDLDSSVNAILVRFSVYGDLSSRPHKIYFLIFQC